MNPFQTRLQALTEAHQRLTAHPNEPQPATNGLYRRYAHPVLTADHVPVEWRYDLNPVTNPYILERIGVNAVFNPGAMKWQANTCWWRAWKGWTAKASSPSLKVITEWMDSGSGMSRS